jgi:hypothetical protein
VLKFVYDLKAIPGEGNPSALKILFDRTFRRSYSFMVLEWLIRNEFLSWLGTKVFASTLLYGVLQLYKVEAYDYRLLAMGVSIVFTSNIILLNHLHRFENHELVIYRGLPLDFMTRLLNMLVPIIIICLPELGMLITHLPKGESFYQIIPFAISILIGYYGLLYWKDWGFEKSVKISFFLLSALIVLIQVKIALLLLIPIIAIAGLLLWKTKYYQFEYTRTDT